MGMLDQWGIDTGAVGEILATDPDDPEYINRLRNVAEGVIAGGIVEAIGWGIRARKANKAGNLAKEAEFKAKEAEALKPLDETLREQAIKETDEAKEKIGRAHV